MKIFSFTLLALLLPTVAGADSTPANFEDAILRAAADDQGREVSEDQIKALTHQNKKSVSTDFKTDFKIDTRVVERMRNRMIDVPKRSMTKEEVRQAIEAAKQARAKESDDQIRAIIEQDEAMGKSDAAHTEGVIRGLIKLNETRGEKFPQSEADCHTTPSVEEFEACKLLLQDNPRMSSARNVPAKSEKSGYSREQSDKKSIDFVR